MLLHGFEAHADLIGHRVRLGWTVRFDEGETLGDAPIVRVRRKERDFQFPPVESGVPDPFGVYDAAAFPPPGATLAELPLEERRDGDRRILTRVASVWRAVAARRVEVLRRTWTTTLGPADAPLERRVELVDYGETAGGLAANTVYYYVLEQPGAGTPLLGANARAGGFHGLERRVYELLPAVHRRWDTVLRQPTPGAEAIVEAAPGAGQLRRLVGLFGSAFDLMRSLAEGVPGLRDLDAVDARYLPLLARWIGWELRHDVSIPVRRHEIKLAPALYRLTGSIPSLHLWTRRATGWETRVKEYVHNVFRTNDPPHHTVWVRTEEAGTWSEPVQPLVLDDAVSGRPAAVADAAGTLWLFYHTFKQNRWGVWVKTRVPGQPWTTSAPLTAGRTLDRYPAAAVRPDGTLWLFWTSYDTARDAWSVRLRVRSAAGVWGPPEVFGGAGASGRRYPSTTVAADGTLWLVWMERGAAGWGLRYARHDGAWSAPLAFPPDGGAVVRVHGRPAVCGHDAAGQRLWVAFVQEAPGAEPGQTRRTVVVRAKADLNADAAGWGAVDEVSARPPAAHDDDPALFVDAAGALVLVFASDRADGWSLWRRVYDAALPGWGGEEALPRTPYAERDPAPVVHEGRTLLAYRSNRSPVYESDEARGIRSVDFRYTGSATAHVRNAAALALYGGADDVGSYTYDLGPAAGARADADRYADDTVGLFLEPDTVDGAAVEAGVARLRQVLAGALPCLERATVHAEPDLHTEYVYDYRRGTGERRVEEAYLDAFTSVLTTVVLGDLFDFTDSLEA